MGQVTFDDVLYVVFGLYGVVMLFLAWTRRADKIIGAKATGRTSDRVPSGFTRLAPLVSILMILCGIFGVVTFVEGDNDGVVEYMVAAVLVAAIFAAWPLAVAIVTLNRPKFLVAPHRRDEPGSAQIRREREQNVRHR